MQTHYTCHLPLLFSFAGFVFFIKCFSGFIDIACLPKCETDSAILPYQYTLAFTETNNAIIPLERSSPCYLHSKGQIWSAAVFKLLTITFTQFYLQFYKAFTASHTCNCHWRIWVNCLNHPSIHHYSIYTLYLNMKPVFVLVSWV